MHDPSPVFVTIRNRWVDGEFIRCRLCPLDIYRMLFPLEFHSASVPGSTSADSLVRDEVLPGEEAVYEIDHYPHKHAPWFVAFQRDFGIVHGTSGLAQPTAMPANPSASHRQQTKQGLKSCLKQTCGSGVAQPSAKHKLGFEAAVQWRVEYEWIDHEDSEMLSFYDDDSTDTLNDVARICPLQQWYPMHCGKNSWKVGVPTFPY